VRRGCYEWFTGCVVGCFVEHRSGDQLSSWQIAAECNRRCLPDSFGTSAGYFASEINSYLTECIIGSEDPSEPDAGTDEGDGGTLMCTNFTCYPQSPCVEKCFPGWQ
jgi:hypothetical protein